MGAYLLLPRIKVQNANGAASSYTVGFPAMTAFLGAVHALERKLRAGWQDINFPQTAVAVHKLNTQLYRGDKDFRYSIIGTANPLKKSKKSGEYERPPFIEEPRCHMEVSLLLSVKGLNSDNRQEVEKEITSLLWQMKLAGGDITGIGRVTAYFIDDEDNSTSVEYKIKRHLMPGYIVCERRDLMKIPPESAEDSLERLMDMLAVEYTPVKNEGGQLIGWQGKRRTSGWIVPLAVGFKDLSGPAPVKSLRATGYEHHFVESVVTLGEFKLPYRYRKLDEMMWEYHVDEGHGLYLCRNQRNS